METNVFATCSWQTPNLRDVVIRCVSGDLSPLDDLEGAEQEALESLEFMPESETATAVGESSARLLWVVGGAGETAELLDMLRQINPVRVVVLVQADEAIQVMRLADGKWLGIPMSCPQSTEDLEDWFHAADDNDVFSRLESLPPLEGA